MQRFRARVIATASRLGVTPHRIRVQRMRHKWGSCSLGGTLTFSRTLLRQPRAFQHVVIVHELLHLRVRNHGKLFKAWMSLHAPGWREVALACHSVSGREQRH